MPSSSNYTTVFWVIMLLHLAACSQVPVVNPPSPAPSVPAQARVPADPSRNIVTNTAQQMLGAPYRYGGSSPTGFDCSGLVWYSHRLAGIRIPRTALQQYRSALKRVAVQDLQYGDLLFFRIGARRTDHVGIYVGNGQFVHAPSRGGRVSRASLNNAYWKNRLTGAGNYY